jgi:hypothetical protein
MTAENKGFNHRMRRGHHAHLDLDGELGLVEDEGKAAANGAV